MKYWYNLLPLSASKIKSEEISLFGNLWLELWYLMPLSTIFQLYRGSQLFWWRKPDYP